MSDKYDKPCFDDPACEDCGDDAVVRCDEELGGTVDVSGCSFLNEGGTWESCTDGKLSPHYAEYAGRKVIVDVEGLRYALCELSFRRNSKFIDIDDVTDKIDARIITAPDLVRREDMEEATRNCDYSPCESYVFDSVPEWDGKE